MATATTPETEEVPMSYTLRSLTYVETPAVDEEAGL